MLLLQPLHARTHLWQKYTFHSGEEVRCLRALTCHRGSSKSLDPSYLEPLGSKIKYIRVRTQSIFQAYVKKYNVNLFQLLIAYMQSFLSSNLTFHTSASTCSSDS